MQGVPVGSFVGIDGAAWGNALGYRERPTAPQN